MQRLEATDTPPTCAGPDPEPRPPRIDVPAAACDCHAHVFGPAALHPYQEPRAYTPPDAPLSDYLRTLDRLGLDRGVLVQPSIYGTDNDCLIDGVQRAGGRLRGVIVADPRRLSDSRAEELWNAGIRGIRLNMVAPGGLDPADLEALGTRLEEIGWHLDLIVDRVQRLVELEGRLGSLRCELVIEQMGRINAEQAISEPGFQALLRLVRDKAVWVKLSHAYHISRSGPPYGDIAPFATALIEAGPDRMVWGSDWPHPMVHGPMPNDGDLLDLLAEWAPDAALRRRILVDNPARLYGFPPA